MPDQDKIIDEVEKAPIAAKLALLVGILPKTCMSDISPYLSSTVTIDNNNLPYKIVE